MNRRRVDLRDVLSRADVDVLSRVFGLRVVRTLRALASTGGKSLGLSDGLLGTRSRVDLLRDPLIRAEIIDLLRPDEASDLFRVLGVAGAFSYRALQQFRFVPSRFRLLADFFGVSLNEDFDEPEAKGQKSSVEPGYALFGHQAEAARRCAEHLWRGRGRALLHMPTGSGKTRTAMTLVCDFLRRCPDKAVVWLAHSDELCEQAAEEFEKAWRHVGDRPVDLHRFWGARELEPREVRGGLVVAGLQKVRAAIRQSIPFVGVLGARSGFVILDEAHQAIAPTYRLILDSLVEPNRETALLGLTATPGRTWNSPDQDEELAAYFDYTKVRLEIDGYANPVDYLTRNGYLARASFLPMKVASRFGLSASELRDLSDELDVSSSVLERLAEDDQRTLAILSEVERLSRRHRRTIVFATTVEHAVVIASVLNVRGVKAAAITGETPHGERKWHVDQFRSDGPEHRVLCNFGVLTAGFDVPATSAAVIARPTMSLVLYSQMVGRATRGPRAGGSPVAEIVTVVDSALPGFGDLSEAFANWEDVWGNS